MENIGLSNFNDINIIQENTSVPIFANQIEISPFWQKNELVEYLNQNNCTFVFN